MPISKSDGEFIVDPYRRQLTQCIRGGVVDDYEWYTEKAYVHTLRTKANIRRDHVVTRIMEAFHGLPNTGLIEKNDGLFLLVLYSPIINQTLAIRFKKLDNTLKAANIPTQQAEMFDDQFPLPEVPPKATYANAGYTLNQIGTDVDGVYITCPNGPNDFYWIISIDEGESVQPVELLPTLPQEPILPPRRVRVRGEQDIERTIGDESAT